MHLGTSECEEKTKGEEDKSVSIIKISQKQDTIPRFLYQIGKGVFLWVLPLYYKEDSYLKLFMNK